MDSSFACPLCGKSFDNKRSHIRHGRYCRKKARLPEHSRKKSCQRCVVAKARCDGARPACSRCEAKGLACIFDRPQAPERRVNTTARVVAPLTVHPDADIELYNEETPADLSLPFGNAADPAFESLPSSVVGFDESLAIATSYSLSVEGYTGRKGDTSSFWQAGLEAPFSPQTQPYRNTIDPVQSLTSRPIIEAPSFSLSSPLSGELMLRTPQAFQLKAPSRNGPSLLRKFIMRQLSSYPHRLQPSASLPPFVHAGSINIQHGPEGGLLNQCLPEPLADCAATVSMWSIKSDSNAALCWKKLRMEQEKLSANCSAYDDFEAVAALQAITVYLLLRVAEHNEEYTNFDIPLIHTMLALAARVKGISNRYASHCMNGLPTWEGWALAESLRRAIIVVFMINYFFDMSAGTQHVVCESAQRWAEMLLPSSKALWAARTGSEWEQEYRLAKDWERPTFGDLLQHGAELDLEETPLNRWLAGADEFGMLVVAAGGLVEQETARRAH